MGKALVTSPETIIPKVLNLHNVTVYLSLAFGALIQMKPKWVVTCLLSIHGRPNEEGSRYVFLKLGYFFFLNNLLMVIYT